MKKLWIVLGLIIFSLSFSYANDYDKRPSELVPNEKAMTNLFTYLVESDNHRITFYNVGNNDEELVDKIIKYTKDSFQTIYFQKEYIFKEFRILDIRHTKSGFVIITLKPDKNYKSNQFLINNKDMVLFFDIDKPKKIKPTKESVDNVLKYMADSGQYKMTFYGNGSVKEIKELVEVIKERYRYNTAIHRGIFDGLGRILISYNNHGKVTIEIQGIDGLMRDELYQSTKKYRENMLLFNQTMMNDLELEKVNSEYEKAIQIVDYLNAYYDYDFEQPRESSSGRIVFNKRLTTCAGYSSAFEILSKLNGINVETADVITKQGGLHSINHVLLDGEEFFIDVSVSDVQNSILIFSGDDCGMYYLPKIVGSFNF